MNRLKILGLKLIFVLLLLPHFSEAAQGGFLSKKRKLIQTDSLLFAQKDTVVTKKASPLKSDTLRKLNPMKLELLKKNSLIRSMPGGIKQVPRSNPQLKPQPVSPVVQKPVNAVPKTIPKPF